MSSCTGVVQKGMLAYTGGIYEFALSVIDGQGKAVDITGASVKVNIASSPGEALLWSEGSAGPNINIIDAAGGAVQVIIPQSVVDTTLGPGLFAWQAYIDQGAGYYAMTPPTAFTISQGVS